MAGWRFYLNEIEVEEPIGWDGVEFTAKRMESHGMDQPFSTELTFYELGARLIKAEYDASFINANITLFIQSDVITDGVAWSYVGYIDLSMYSEKNVCDTDSWEITVGILEDNFREKFKARMDVEVDLLSIKDLDQNAIDPISLHETRLHCQELFLAADGASLSPTVTNILYIYSNGWIQPDFCRILPLYWNNSDFKGVFGNTFDPTGLNWTDTNAFLKNNSDFTRTFQYNLAAIGAYGWSVVYSEEETASIALSVQVFNSANAQTQREYLWDSLVFNNADGTLYYDFTIPNQTLVLEPGDRALVFFQWGGLGNIVPGDTVTENYSINLGITSCCMNITELNSSADASLAKGLLVKDYLDRLTYILTGQQNAIISDYFEPETGCEWANMLTTGLYIRNASTIDSLVNGCGITDEGDLFYSIKTTFKKTFEDLSKIFCLGWQYEQQEDLSWKIRIEPVDYFYQMNLMASFENVGEIRQYALTDKLVNNITLGYSDKWKNIAVSGIFEIHTERNYFVKNKAMSRGSSSKLDLKSDIIASGYAIEFSRRLQFLRDDSGSSDRPNDYETFIIALNSEELTFDVTNSGYQLPEETGVKTFAPAQVSYGSNFITVSNAPISRIYNIPLTPMRNAIRWWKMLGMHTFGLSATDAKLFFQVGEYYTTYSSEIISSCLEEIQGEVLAENMDISKDVLQPAYQEYLFKPIGLEFSYPQTLCGFITMGDPGNGCVSVSSGSFNSYGFIQESANKPEDNSGGTTNFTLYLSNRALPTGRPYSDGYSDGFE
jgi:hypothetical protein